MKPGGARRKGGNFERAIAAHLRRYFPAAQVRRGRQGEGAVEPDIVIAGVSALDAWWLELCDARRPDVDAKMHQAMRDSAREGRNRQPVVIWHQYRARHVNATWFHAFGDLHVMVTTKLESWLLIAAGAPGDES